MECREHTKQQPSIERKKPSSIESVRRVKSRFQPLTSHSKNCSVGTISPVVKMVSVTSESVRRRRQMEQKVSIGACNEAPRAAVVADKMSYNSSSANDLTNNDIDKFPIATLLTCFALAFLAFINIDTQ